MNEQTEFIQRKLSELMTECANYTIKTLKELSDDPKHKLGPTRVVILSLLVETWNKTPLPMGIPNELRELSRYANKDNLFVYHAGELIKMLNLVKGEGSIYTNLNLN